MGFKTIAIARGEEKRELALKLGAHEYVDSRAVDPGAELQKRGGAKVILATATAADAMEALVRGLAIDGQLLIVGAAHEPVKVNTVEMIGGRQGLRAWASGTCVDSEDAMAFSVLTGVRPMIETIPLERAAEAYEGMLSGKARFRMVLTTK